MFLLCRYRMRPFSYVSPFALCTPFVHSDHTPCTCAIQEAGVTGTVGPKLGPFEIKAGHQVQKMWLLFVDNILGDDDPTWEERGIRERRWCAIEDAPKLLNPDNPKGYVTDLQPLRGRRVAEAYIPFRE